MDIYKVERTSRTPFVLMDGKKGVIEIKGISIPNNSYEFYLPLFELIDKYVLNPATQTIVNLHLEYLNTSTSKALLEMFKKLSVLENVEFNWHFDVDDEEMLEHGKNYEALLDCPFNFFEFSMN
jgi:Domain of unknown function (DUF1987).